MCELVGGSHFFLLPFRLGSSCRTAQAQLEGIGRWKMNERYWQHMAWRERSWVNVFCQSFMKLGAVDVNENLITTIGPNFHSISGYHFLSFVDF